MFDKLEDWSKSSESAVKYFSGTAVYRKAFNIEQPVFKQQLFLDLGVVKNTARVRVNGKDLGVIWCSPWQLEITDVLKPCENILEIEVANLWRNRLIGDSKLPAGEGRTRTNIPNKGVSTLQSSGLLGPVTIQTIQK